MIIKKNLFRFQNVLAIPKSSSSLLPSSISRRFFYEQTRAGSVEFEEKKRGKMTEAERIKLSAKTVKKDLKWSLSRLKESTIHAFRADTGFVPFDDCQLIKVWDFDQRNNNKISSYTLDYKIDQKNDMNNWIPTCDADFDIGFSKCSWTVSPAGYGLFSGYLDKTLPKDGRTIRTGYAFLGSNARRVPFNMNKVNITNIFVDFTHLILRVRGDGRHYYLSFDTSTNLDITWFDRYQFMMYTFGGPYWQYVKIPLSRFYFQYQGIIQDKQDQLSPDEINSMGILVFSTHPGPFRLEIDYIGFIDDHQHNDISEYESYDHEVALLDPK